VTKRDDEVWRQLVQSWNHRSLNSRVRQALDERRYNGINNKVIRQIRACMPVHTHTHIHKQTHRGYQWLHLNDIRPLVSTVHAHNDTELSDRYMS